MFLTSGLGGMSGAQAKAAVVAGCIGVIAEVGRMRVLVCTEERKWEGVECAPHEKLMSLEKKKKIFNAKI